ncbi:hypothetical protein KXD40_001088 [Peronospora effusa]|uniref:Endonuclease III homolog n=1 Tax=Peronospora effusa TaxID=542832 RepID=A0A3M6VCL5_9STRA|nr:hypothetical protein DD238_006356 [Peronospora effusa]RQM13036.1 hypothetical protein DD237_006703 [Peronospora effusa]UIZ21755.1 hypothetical protein KXD40_001088 [Peronospora effusa]
MLQKRKDVEGCLFVVKRSSSPRFQIFVNNRLSTTNMTLELDGRLQVDNVDSFLILRSPDLTYSSGFAIYGVWFFPEEDRAKILQLLQSLIQTLKAPQSAAIMNSTQQQPVKTQLPPQMQAKPKQLQTAQPTQQRNQQQERPPSQSRTRGRSRNKLDDVKRRISSVNTPTAILQRSLKGTRSNSSSSGSSTNGMAKQENTPVVANSSGMVPISKVEGIAAGEAIMGMISQNWPQQQHKQQSTVSNVNKEQLKQTLIDLLNDAQFFDQIYHAYVDRTSDDGDNPFTRFAFASVRNDSSVNDGITAEITVHQPRTSSAKRARTEEKKHEKASSSRQEKIIKTERKKCSDASHQLQLQLLLELYEARKDIVDTPIDKFGTKMCVAPGVSSANAKRFQLLVAALLSSQTQDPITYAAMQRLHQLGGSDEGLTIATVQATSETKLSEVLKPVGFYHRKAHQLKQVAAILSTRFHGDIPRSLDELLELPGIGPKIGRVITLLAWGQVDGIVVDTHVHRVAQRLGWASTSSPQDTRRDLEEWVPREYWGSLSFAVVGFGQTVCTAKYPLCSTCPLAAKCPSAFKVDTTNTKNKNQSKKRCTYAADT